MKKFVYQVMSFEFVDSVAFGEAWKMAKAMAEKLHCPIFRITIKNDEEKMEVYYKAGCFNSIKFATKENVKIF